MKEIREIAIIKNIEREGSGLFGEILAEHGIKSRVMDLSLGHKPELSFNPGAVVVLGGPDSANDETEKMLSELALIREVLDAEVPYLGICLGLQTMVRASGGDVVRSPSRETGFRDENGDLFRISLTKDGRKDPLFEGIDDFFNVFHLHGETVVLTEKMKLLATGNPCRNQIVKISPNAYGIQCHFELTEQLLGIWMNEDKDLMQLDKNELRTDFIAFHDAYFKTGRQLFLNFLKIAGYPV